MMKKIYVRIISIFLVLILIASSIDLSLLVKASDINNTFDQSVSENTISKEDDSALENDDVIIEDEDDLIISNDSDAASINKPVVNGTVVDWDCVYFGALRQYDTSSSKDKIKWRVLDVKDDTAYLMTDICLRRYKFNSEKGNINWIDSALRIRLNGESFYNAAFSAAEKEAIKPIVIDENQVDYVSIPSYADITNKEYGFIDKNSRKAMASQYIVAQNASLEVVDGNVNYWLKRNSSTNEYSTMRIVMSNGDIDKDGVAVTSTNVAVRVVVQMDLSSNAWLYAGTVSNDPSRNHEIKYAKVTFDYNDGVTPNESKYMDVSGTYGELPVPVRDGFTFDGWYYNDGTDYIKISSEDILKSSENHTIKARWNEQIKVTFNANGGSVSVAYIYLEPGSIYGELPRPNRSGYLFRGWYYGDGENEKEITSDSIVAQNENHELKAKWENGYEIKFDPCCDEIDPIYIERKYGDKLGELPVLEREGYTLIGWYSNPNYNYSAITSDWIVQSEYCFYAKWQKLVTVTFDADGGKCDVKSRKYKYGEKYGELPVPTREGYIFIGWSDYWNGRAIVPEYERIKSYDIKLRARWLPVLPDEIEPPVVDNNEYTYEYDIVYLGSYYCYDTNGDRIFDEDDDKQYIEWIVADINGDDVTLVSRDIIDARKFCDSKEDMSWNNSDLRKWLNSKNQYSGNGFYDIAFSEKEKEGLIQNDNEDYVSLISLSDVAADEDHNIYRYYHSITSYANSKYQHLSNSSYYRQAFWLLSDNNEKAACWYPKYTGYYLSDLVSLYEYNDSIDYSIGVRPVIHVKKSANILNRGGRTDSSDTYYDLRYLLFDPCGGQIDTYKKGIRRQYVVGELPVPVREGYYFDGWYTKKEGGEKILENTNGYDFEETSTTLYAHWMKKPDITLHNPYIDENGRRVCDVVNFGHYLSWDNDDELHYTDGLVNEYDEKVRIPWIVLKVDGDDAFLVSEYALDSLKYNESRSGVSWEDSTIRSWLNGYDASKNAEGKDYTKNNFYDEAFNNVEKQAIISTDIEVFDRNKNDNKKTNDKVFLLSIEDAINEEYGYDRDPYKRDEARDVSATDYANRRSENNYSSSRCSWWLRDTAPEEPDAYICHETYGEICGVYVNSGYAYVVPAIHIKLSSDAWRYDGVLVGNSYDKYAYIVSFDADGGTSPVGSKYVYYEDKYGELPVPEKSGYVFKGWYQDREHTQLATEDSVLDKMEDITLYAHWVPDSASMLNNPAKDEKGAVTWDTIYFGHYIQSDTNHDGIIDEKDALEPIRWRVLDVDNNKAMLLSDKILDYRPFDNSSASDNNIGWESSEIGDWLNGCGEYSNASGKNFIDTAFTIEEQSSIYETRVKYNKLHIDNTNYRSDICYNKVLLMSLQDICNPKYGFAASGAVLDPARKGVLTDFTKSLIETEVPYDSNGSWSLRNVYQNDTEAFIAQVDENGSTYNKGNNLNYTYVKNGIRPVIYIDLTNSNWIYSGSISSDGAGKEIKDVLVSFDAKGGTVINESKYVSVGYPYEYLPIPAKEGCIFEGWYTAENQLITDQSIVRINKDHVLYAKWKNYNESDDIVLIKFDANGGVVYTSSKNVIFNDVYGLLPTAVRDGYVFEGWYTEKDGGKLISSDSVVDNNNTHTLYARWSINPKQSVFVSFDANGGSCETVSMNAIVGEKYGELPVATKEKQVFAGWYTEKTGGICVNADTVVDNINNHVLYAHYDNISLATRQKYDISEYFKNIDGIKKYKVTRIDGGKASVSKKGKLTALHEGKVSIIPLVKKGKKYVPAENAQPLVITITKPKLKKTVKLDKTGEVINLNDYLTDAPINSNKIVWSVSNKDICNVDENTGVMTVLKAGTVKVNASIINNQGYVLKLKMTFKIKKQ